MNIAMIIVFSDDIDTSTQSYNFTFNINEKLDNLNITLLIDGSFILVPYWCQSELTFIITCY